MSKCAAWQRALRTPTAVGFDCEHSFLPALLEASKNPHIQPGAVGYVDCSQGIAPLEVPLSTDHSEGDVHPYGNPHYLLDPVLARTAIQNIYHGLVAVRASTGSSR
jgi:zinc/manganese transport system substrate-binding protein